MARMTKFTEWLNQELQVRDWKPANLAAKADISRAILSLYISGDRQPGFEVCTKIARAFGVNPVDVFIIADLLDEKDKDRLRLRPFDKTVIGIIQSLISQDQQEGFLEIAKAFTQVSTHRGRTKQAQ